jgi:putative ABC transport system ATP-binding protein
MIETYSPTSAPLLQLQSISVELSNKGQALPILRDISEEFTKGQMIAVVGPSGSGKTTLLMACAGLIPVQSGKILFRGYPLPLGQEKQMTEWRRQNAGIIFQNFHLLPAQTALENVSIPLELNGDKEAQEKAKEMLGRVGLSHRLDHLPSALSGGEQQRVALARAMIMEPPLILADEPTGNLDQDNGHKVMALLEDQVRQLGATLILITHDPELAKRCDRQIHILDGRIQSKTQTS